MKPNRPMDQTTIPSGLPSCFLLIPIGKWGTRGKIDLPLSQGLGTRAGGTSEAGADWSSATLGQEMKKLANRLVLIFVMSILIQGCVTFPRQQVTYRDSNGDGVIDQEYHNYSAADMNWELLDEDYDGRYDKKIYHGFANEIMVVDIAVPRRKA